MMRRLDEVVEAARKRGPARVAIAAAHDPDVIEAMKKAGELGLAEGIFVGDRAKILSLAEGAG
ncbi:MAG: hypothetical protein JNN08_23005, partial [Bryobacterales bacterium]|nr:hypothetical protein [Bryobacterales bacterium]